MKKKDPTSHRIIEKRRRDRMNNCLADLSRLIPAHYMKKGRGRVEKTEIIEMAIRHLKDLIKLTNAQQAAQQHQQTPNEQPSVSSMSPTSSSNLSEFIEVSTNATTMAGTQNRDPHSYHPHRPRLSKQDMRHYQHRDMDKYLSEQKCSVNGELSANQKPSDKKAAMCHRDSQSSADSGSGSESNSSSYSSSNDSRRSQKSSQCCLGNSELIDNCLTCSYKTYDEASPKYEDDGATGNGRAKSGNVMAWYKKAWLVRSYSSSSTQR